jgi:DNA-binding MarR family transcriptional regulator
MNDPLALRFDGCMATNIEQAYRHLEQVYERLIGPLGLNVLEWYALRALYAEDGLSASSWPDRMPPPPMTALDRMEKRIAAPRDGFQDRRSVRVFLTDQGRRVQPQVRRSRTRWHTRPAR